MHALLLKCPDELLIPAENSFEKGRVRLFRPDCQLILKVSHEEILALYSISW
jgi:hypothetical protein